MDDVSETQKTQTEKKISDCKTLKEKPDLLNPSLKKLNKRAVGKVLLHLMIFISAVVAILPMPIGHFAFYTHLKLSALLHAIEVIAQNGRPQLTKEYLFTLLQQNQFNWFFSCWLFHLARPGFFINLAQSLRSAAAVVGFIKTVFVKLYPAVASYGDKLLLLDLRTLTAQLEVALAFVFTFDLLFPPRNLMLCFAYWMSLRIRYMIALVAPYADKSIITAFAVVRQQLDEVFLRSSWSPALLGKVYSFVIQKIEGMVELPNANAPSSPRCSLM